MTSALQNRLVGTIIVVALVVILLPELLDGEKRTSEQNFVDVPPVLEIVKVPKPDNLDLRSVEQEVSRPIEVVDETALDDTSVDNEAVNTTDLSNNDVKVSNESTKSEIIDDSPQAPSNSQNEANKLSANSLDEIDIKDSGWVVQLGSFRHEKNVKALLKTLNDAGYRAYSNPVMTSVGRLNKVFVGPELDRESLERALPHLQEITQLKGKITAFEVSAK